jgi:hypothetical protein
MRLAALCLLASFAALAQEPPPPPPPVAPAIDRARLGGGALVMADDGGFDRVTARTLHSLTAAELRKHGVTISDDPRFHAVIPVDGLLSDMLQQMGVTRLFVLRVGGKLGKKVPLALEEIEPSRLSTVFAADLVATGMEETDRNIARLVEAVLDRKSAGDTAGMQTVTVEEKRPFQEMPGRRFWAVGFPFGFQGSTGRTYGTPLGVSAAWMYEAQWARIDVQALFETHGSSSTFFAGIVPHWVPLDRQISPYVGLGVGYLLVSGSDGALPSASTKYGGGMGLAAEGGVEMARLQGFRIMAGVQVLIPLFKTDSLSLSAPVTPLAHVRFAF